MTTPYVIEMIAKYLSDNGFDGLCNEDCGCEMTNLSPGNCLAEDCQAGYRAPCDCGDHDWHIQTSKPKEPPE